MNRKKYVMAVVAVACAALSGYAQSEVEGLRFSRTFGMGTARFSSMGGAFTALGGDLTTLSFNPAGIGVYRSSEFALTPGILYSGTTSSYMGHSANDNRYQLAFSNIGGVGVINMLGDALVSINIGVTYNKYNAFSQRYAVRSGEIGMGGYTDYFANVGNHAGFKSNNESNDEAVAMAEATGVVWWDTAAPSQYKSVLDLDDRTTQRRNGEVRGDIGEYAFSMGANIKHFLYFGMTLGVQSVSFYEDITDAEYAVDGNQSTFRNFKYRRTYQQDGVGYNFKFGLIVRPFVEQDFLTGLRIGAAIHTPTILSMHDGFTHDMSSLFENENPYHDSSDPNKYAYNIETPMRVMAGLAYTFGDQTTKLTGTLSADYEYADYSHIKMRANDDDHASYSYDAPERGYDFDLENSNIATLYRATSNLRFGGELNYGVGSFRLGYARYGNPYKSDIYDKGAVNIFSGGLGVHNRYCFFDVSYSLMQQNSEEYMYNATVLEIGADVKSDKISYKTNQHRILLTFGLRF